MTTYQEIAEEYAALAVSAGLESARYAHAGWPLPARLWATEAAHNAREALRLGHHLNAR